jgi:hypothetical protein
MVWPTQDAGINELRAHEVYGGNEESHEMGLEVMSAVGLALSLRCRFFSFPLIFIIYLCVSHDTRMHHNGPVWQKERST